MTEDLQPGQHLSPDQLSAFAENVLPDHERRAALTHLAECANCRQVVFLAQQADPALSASPVPVDTPRRGWFTLPQIFGAATAALACSLILALIIHQRHAGPPSTAPIVTAKVEQPPVLAPPVPTSAPNTTAAPPSASPAGISAAAANTSLTSPTDIALKPMPQPSRLAEPRTLGAIGAGISSGSFTESKQQDKAIYGYSAPSANTYTALPPKAPAAVASAMPAPPPPPAPESRLREATNDSTKLKKDLSAAETVTVTAAAPSMDATSQLAADSLTLNSIQNLPLSGRAAMMNQAAAKPAPQKTIQLPSKKPAVSVLTAADHTLALDTAGALFLSTDFGKHWTAVTQQWPGKAVQLTYAATPPRLYLQQPAQNQTQNQSNNSINGNSANNGLSKQQAPIPAAGFDLTTATGAVWHSTDGLTWHQR